MDKATGRKILSRLRGVVHQRPDEEANAACKELEGILAELRAEGVTEAEPEAEPEEQEEAPERKKRGGRDRKARGGRDRSEG